MIYPEFDCTDSLINDLRNYARLKCEQGVSEGVKQILSESEQYLRDAVNRISGLPDDGQLKKQEPDDLPSILMLREEGPRKLWYQMPEASVLHDKMSGALLGRMIGCILGSPVELMSMEDMRSWSEHNREAFPPVDFWEYIEKPYRKNFYGAYRY